MWSPATLTKKKWPSVNRCENHGQKCDHLLKDKSVVTCITDKKKYPSAHRQSVVICTLTKLWSSDFWFSAHRQKCGYLLRDKCVVICSETRVWSSAHRQKCVHLQFRHLHTDESEVICTHREMWSSASQICLFFCTQAKCSILLTDKSVFMYSQTKVWLPTPPSQCLRLDFGKYRFPKVH